MFKLRWRKAWWGAVLAGLACGCASTDVNPPVPRGERGYLDLYSQAADLAWDLQQFDTASGRFRTVFSKLKPPETNVLRVELEPGKPRLRVALLNRSIAAPVEFEPEIKAGEVTPVGVALEDAGEVAVRTKTWTYGGTARGRVGSRTEIEYRTNRAYRLRLTPSLPEAYRPKEQMPYAQAMANKP